MPFFGFGIQPFANERQGSLEPFWTTNTLSLASEASTTSASNTDINEAFAFSGHAMNARFSPYNEHESHEN
jgi:hypothetical protein